MSGSSPGGCLMTCDWNLTYHPSAMTRSGRCWTRRRSSHCCASIDNRRALIQKTDLICHTCLSGILLRKIPCKRE